MANQNNVNRPNPQTNQSQTGSQKDSSFQKDKQSTGQGLKKDIGSQRDSSVQSDEMDTE